MSAILTTNGERDILATQGVRLFDLAGGPALIAAGRLHDLSYNLLKDKLPTVINLVIATIRAGELDEVIRQAAKGWVLGKPKAAWPATAKRRQ
jgi:hypothetical protein